MSTSIFGGTPIPVLVSPKPENPTPAPKPKEPAGIVERLKSKFSESAHKLDRMQREVEENNRAMREAGSELNGLASQLKDATEILSRADDLFATRKAQFAEREALFLNAWGEVMLPQGPDYGPLLAMRASIEDFPRCRAHLVTKVEAAKKALSKFEQSTA